MVIRMRVNLYSFIETILFDALFLIYRKYALKHVFSLSVFLFSSKKKKRNKRNCSIMFVFVLVQIF